MDALQLLVGSGHRSAEPTGTDRCACIRHPPHISLRQDADTGRISRLGDGRDGAQFHRVPARSRFRSVLDRAWQRPRARDRRGWHVLRSKQAVRRVHAWVRAAATSQTRSVHRCAGHIARLSVERTADWHIRLVGAGYLERGHYPSAVLLCEGTSSPRQAVGFARRATPTTTLVATPERRSEDTPLHGISTARPRNPSNPTPHDIPRGTVSAALRLPAWHRLPIGRSAHSCGCVDRRGLERRGVLLGAVRR